MGAKTMAAFGRNSSLKTSLSASEAIKRLREG